MQETKETWIQSLGQEDPLEQGMAINSSILAWRIPWTEEPDGLHPMGHKESDTTEETAHLVHTCTHAHACLLLCCLIVMELKQLSDFGLLEID